MRQRIAGTSAVACAMALSSAASAEVRMPPIFAGGMVLQRELPVPVWGTASPGEKITVSFAGQELGRNSARPRTTGAGGW